MPGFDINRFVGLSESEAKHLKCSICLNIFRNAIRSKCDHTFCKQCVENWIKSNNNNNNCPECRTVFESNLTTSCDNNTLVVRDFVFRFNLMANNMINDLKIKCDNDWNGCQTVTQLGSLSSHLKECKHKLCKICGLTVEGNVEKIHQMCIKQKSKKSIEKGPMKLIENGMRSMKCIENGRKVIKYY